MLVDQNKKGYCFLLSICKIQLQVLWHAGIKCIHIHLYKKYRENCFGVSFLHFSFFFTLIQKFCNFVFIFATCCTHVVCSKNKLFLEYLVFYYFLVSKVIFFSFFSIPLFFFILAFLNACTRFVHKCVNIVLKWQQNFNVKNISEKSYNKIQFNMHISTQFSMNIKNNRNSYKQKEFKKHTYTFYGNKK